MDSLKYDQLDQKSCWALYSFSQVRKDLKTSIKRLESFFFDDSWRLTYIYEFFKHIQVVYLFHINLWFWEEPYGEFLGNTKSDGGFRDANGKLVDSRQQRSKHCVWRTWIWQVDLRLDCENSNRRVTLLVTTCWAQCFNSFPRFSLPKGLFHLCFSVWLLAVVWFDCSIYWLVDFYIVRT